MINQNIVIYLPSFIAYIGKDYPLQLPIQVQSVVQVTEQSERYGIYDAEDWHSLLPPKHGYVALGPNHREFGVSMYHQLHCLNTLRIASIHNNTEFGHISHCLDYLRQAILCQADTTLEESEVDVRPDGVLDSGATGLGVTHICRDWTQIRRFVETNIEQRTKGASTNTSSQM